MANQVSGALTVTANVTAGSEAAYKKLREEIDAALATALVTEIKGATIDTIVVSHSQRTLIGEQAEAPGADDDTQEGPEDSEGTDDDPNNDSDGDAAETVKKGGKKAKEKSSKKGSKKKGRK